MFSSQWCDRLCIDSLERVCVQWSSRSSCPEQGSVNYTTPTTDNTLDDIQLTHTSRKISYTDTCTVSCSQITGISQIFDNAFCSTTSKKLLLEYTLYSERAISVLDRKRLSLHLVHCTIWLLSTQLVHKQYTASTQLVRNVVQSY